MTILLLNQDRKAFAKALAERTGNTSKYLGAPSFGYQVGEYLVKRDNTIEVDDDKADREVLREFFNKGFIDNSWDEDRDVLDITLPLDGHTGSTLTNLLRIIYARSEILSRAIGCAGAFKVSEELIEALSESQPDTVDEFKDVLNEAGGNEINTGIRIEDEITFTGFPFIQDSETVKAYMDLASLINQMALSQKRVNIEKPDLSNERYSFRVWLLRLGMIGDEYKATRKILLSKLSGHSAFRTKEAEEIAREKNKAAREAARKEAE